MPHWNGYKWVPRKYCYFQPTGGWKDKISQCGLLNLIKIVVVDSLAEFVVDRFFETGKLYKTRPEPDQNPTRSG